MRYIATDSFELMRYIASCGSSPNVKASSGDVALHVSVRLGSVAACNFLISAGLEFGV
jgi:hypothetical protein